MADNKPIKPKKAAPPTRPAPPSSSSSSSFSTRSSSVSRSVRSDALAEETRLMEERLAALKLAMNNEKQKRVQLPKTKEGNYWAAARKVPRDNFVDHVFENIENKKRHAQQNIKSAYEAPRKQTFEKTLKQTASIPATDSAPAPAPVASDDPAPGSLLAGAYDHAQASQEFQQARLEWLKQQQQQQQTTSKEENSEKPSLLSTWAGDFDEAENARAFAEARQAFLQQPQQQTQKTEHNSQRPKKQSCYHCYRIYESLDPVLPGSRSFCSPSCSLAHSAASVAACAGCGRNDERKLMKKRERGLLCQQCADKELMDIQQEHDRINNAAIHQQQANEEQTTSQQRHDKANTLTDKQQTEPEIEIETTSLLPSDPASVSASVSVSSPVPLSPPPPVAPVPVFSSLIVCSEPLSAAPDQIEIPE